MTRNYRPPGANARRVVWLLIASFLSYLVFLAVIYPVFTRGHGHGRFACPSNLNRLSLAITMYRQDWDQTFPPAYRWADSIFPYSITWDARSFRCTQISHPADWAGCDYGYNNLLHARSTDEIADLAVLPMLFESDAGLALNGSRNVTDRLRSFAPRHLGGKGYVAFADGHVEFVETAPDAYAGLKEATVGDQPR